ncbi:hypothetical protein [Candidatus Enterovibrio escicola]|nr:hypothetical protein [Candidatus Enterovibrio escacola]
MSTTFSDFPPYMGKIPNFFRYQTKKQALSPLSNEFSELVSYMKMLKFM